MWGVVVGEGVCVCVGGLFTCKTLSGSIQTDASHT
jgi:hypothetical protein